MHSLFNCLSSQDLAGNVSVMVINLIFRKLLILHQFLDYNFFFFFLTGLSQPYVFSDSKRFLGEFVCSSKEKDAPWRFVSILFASAYTDGEMELDRIVCF